MGDMALQFALASHLLATRGGYPEETWKIAAEWLAATPHDEESVAALFVRASQADETPTEATG